MKSYITTILLFFTVAVSSYAQKIAVDEENENGVFIATDFLPTFWSNNSGNGSVSLGVAYNTAMQTLFCLNLKLENAPGFEIKKGSALQLITNEGEIIVLHNTSDIQAVDKKIIVSYGVQYNEKELADLDKIMNERIVKLKIETDKGIQEQEVANNLFSKSVYSCYIVLKDYLEKYRND
ncbi:MAG: hypothetical protein IKP81_08125 [Paludibacteraceae bacterium]|nr:hypothetical protein [Paludibacteraceae bacterium]MBR6105009.1 hypothetical protein [Paludibacteraceae bacterium]